jgi:ferrochelatase
VSETPEAIPYDALLLLSFGGPERREDVIPFLENVLQGKRVPRERLEAVAEHYYHFGGKSPINDQNRALLEALRGELEREGPRLPIYWGNLHWHPMVGDTVRQMRDDGVQRAVVFATAGYSSQASCRKYWEALDRAQGEAGEGAPALEKLRPFYNHPGFVEPMAERLAAAYGELSERAPAVFTAHSIPVSMAEASGPPDRRSERGEYVAQLEEACRLVAERAGVPDWKLVFQSRSGPPSQPWLEPDVLDHLRALHEQGTRAAVVAPIGFISDHMEVCWDLDEEARELAGELGMTMVRAGTVGTHPAFVSMIRELVLERAGQTPVRALGERGPAPMTCPPGCCQAA